MPQVKAGVSCAKKISESTEEFAIVELLDAAYRRGRA
jgi:hypothetical protein